MSRGERILLLPLALAACACAVLCARLADQAGLRVELGARRLATVDAATRARLAALDEDVVVTWYRTPPERMPSHLRGLETGVREALGALRDASDGRLAFQVVDPDLHPEWQAFLAAVGLAPWRARRVERDGWREDRLWSSLRITCGARAGAAINGLGPDRLPELQRLVLAHVDELRAPRRPLIAVDAGPGFERLRAELARNAELREVDLEAAPESLGDPDLLVWLDPVGCGEAQLAALDRLLARGGSALVAGSSWREESLAAGDLRVVPAAFPAARFLNHFGLRPVEGVVLDAASEPLALADGSERAAPQRLRSLPNHHDFRTFRAQPNGALLFTAATAHQPAHDRLAELGLEASVLATTTPRAVVLEPPADGGAALALDQLTLDAGAPRGELALATALRPSDPWRGTLVVLGAATPFRDDWIAHELYAHRPLAGALFDTLLAPERLVATRVAQATPAPLDELPAAARVRWRALVLGLGPALLALVALARRGHRRGSPGARRRGGALALRAALALGVALGLAALVPDLGVDLSRDGRNRWTAAERASLARWCGEGLELEAWFSAPAELGPELGASSREARRACAALARALPGVRFRYVEVGALEPDTLRELEAHGIGTHLARSVSEEEIRVRRVACALRVVRGDAAEVLELPDASAFDALRFRIAFAAWRLATGGRGRIALAAEAPRLSPAERAMEYERKGLFAPREGDVFGELSALLEANDFELRHLEPAAGPALAPDELLFWVQPRRDVLPLLTRATEHLAAGGRAVIAAQHHRVLARQLATKDLALEFWPQPQFCDLERHYLPALGVLLAREVLLDTLNAPLDVTTRVERTDGSSSYTQQPSTQPFLIRASEANRPPGADALAGLGDLAFPGGNRVALDDARLGAHGLSAQAWTATGSRAWSYAWAGGALAPELLAGPDDALEGVTLLTGPQPLAVHVVGRFPAAREGLDAMGDPALELVAPTTDGPSGELLLIGGSDLFRNDLIHHPAFRHDQLALRAAAELALPAELAAFLRRRAAAPGLDHVEPDARGAWRAVVLLTFPALLLLFGLLRALARRVAP